MKNRMKWMSVVLCLVLLLSVGAVFADSTGAAEEDDGSKSITNTSVGMERTGAKKALSEVTCQCNVIATWIKAEYQMQKLVGKDYTDVGNLVTSSPQYNTSSFHEQRSWTVSQSGVYRLEVYFLERYNGITTRVGPYYSQSVSL